MFSQKIVNASISALERAFGRDLREYTPEECTEFGDRLSDAFGEKGEPLRAYTPEEQGFVENELLMTKASYRYWAQRYCFINAEGTGLKKMFPLLETQEYVLRRLGKREEEIAEVGGGGIFVNFLKGSRQVGGSTLAESILCHRATTQNNIFGLMASHEPGPKGSGYLFAMFERMYDGLPWWLKPSEIAHVKNEEIAFEGGTRLWVESGKAMKGAKGQRGQIGRGLTISTAHLCIAPNTLIHTKDGFLKPMSEIVVGDTIITHEGELSEVKVIAPSSRTNEMSSEIWTWGAFAPLVTTRDHKILTPSGWKEAKDIEKGSWILHPVRKITQERRLFEYDTKLTGGRHVNRGKFQTSYPLSREWGYMLGLFLAEGTVLKGYKREGANTYTGICWSLDKDEIDEMKGRLQKLLPNAHIGVSSNKLSRTRIMRLHSTGLARWVFKHFGNKDTKRVPDWAWEAGEDFCSGLVEGYLDGDGHWCPQKNEIAASSIRVQILIQMRGLIASLGHGWSAISYRPAGVYYARNCRAIWTMMCNGPTGKSLREAFGRETVAAIDPYHWKWHGEHLAIKVESVTSGFSAQFYDLETVAEAHSFAGVSGVMRNSELSTWELPEPIKDSFLPGVPRTARTFIFFESTAKGRNNWWHSHWKNSPHSVWKFVNIFIPWYVEMKYSEPAPPGWIPADTTLQHAKKIEETSFGCIGKQVVPTKEQLYWWELMRQSFEVDGNLKKFLEEFGSIDADACFQFSGSSIFTTATIERVASQARGLAGVLEIAPMGRLR